MSTTRIAVGPMTPRPLHEIAAEIRQIWGHRAQRTNANPYYAAVPYLQAMAELKSIDDMYGYDRARDIVQYFLSNAQTWRGVDARRIKAELRGMLT